MTPWPLFRRRAARGVGPATAGALATLLAATPLFGSTVAALLTQVGSGYGDQLGLSVGAAGDFNGDGWPDFVAGAPLANAGGTDRGQVWVYFGGPTLDATPDLILSGQADGDQFGASARGCGDVDGDGWDDLIVGAPGNDSAGSNAGRAYVYFGGPAADATADLVLTGEAAGDQFGWSVAGAGDVNGGGNDLVVGAPYAQANAGRVYVFSGGAALDNVADTVMQGPGGTLLGWSVNAAGDFDADGWPDLIAGAILNKFAYLYRGGPAFDAAADLIFTGEFADDRFGYSVAPAGDVNGDGHDDLIIGAMHNDAGNVDGGRAYVYFGGPAPDTTADLVFTGTDYRGVFGRTVAGGGDLNGDGYDDLLVGAPTPDTGGYGPGRMFVFLGGDPQGASPPDTVPDFVLWGEHDNDRMGAQVAMVGDVNGDGRADFLTGANLYDPPGRLDAGKIYLYRVPDERPVALPDSAVTAQDAGVSVPVLANDSDPDGTLVVA
ncbi:MAG: FG-GAP-like repeat-containing protein, partial [Candidatus Krumholzibacteriia bacterium]